MDNETLLYSLFQERNKLKQEAELLDNKNRELKINEIKNKVNRKLWKFADILKTMIKNQENINQKQNSTAIKIQNKSLLSTENSVQLDHKYHNDFINLLESKNKLKKISEGLLNQDSKMDDFKKIINDLKDAYSMVHNNFMERMCEYQSSKGLVENIVELKNIEEDKTISAQNSDSDLGCYPHDSQNSNSTSTHSEFATSSPISFKRSDE